MPQKIYQPLSHADKQQSRDTVVTWADSTITVSSTSEVDGLTRQNLFSRLVAQLHLNNLLDSRHFRSYLIQSLLCASAVIFFYFFVLNKSPYSALNQFAYDSENDRENYVSVNLTNLELVKLPHALVACLFALLNAHFSIKM